MSEHDETVRILLIHPALWARVNAWVTTQGLEMRQMPTDPDELETWTISPSAQAMRAALPPLDGRRRP